MWRHRRCEIDHYLWIEFRRLLAVAMKTMMNVTSRNIYRSEKGEIQSFIFVAASDGEQNSEKSWSET
jgi:hypothetical protein